MRDYSLSPREAALEAKIAAFVQNVVIPYESDPRIDAHGPSDALRVEMQAKAKAAGIALVSLDENFTSDDIGDYSSQILQRRDEAAFLGAQQMASLVAPGASIGTMDFAIAVPSIVFSIEMGKKWATAFGLSVAGNVSNPTDDIAGGEIAGTELLANYPDIAGIIAYNDPSAIGASAAAKSQGIYGLIFGGAIISLVVFRRHRGRRGPKT